MAVVFNTANGIDQITIRQIPTSWDPQWFMTFIQTWLAKGDVRNAKGVGIKITGTGTATATLTLDLTASNTWTGNTTFSPTLGRAITISDTVILSNTNSFSDGSGAHSGTLTNAPAAGNPTKWIPIIDHGTTRYIPAW